MRDIQRYLDLKYPSRRDNASHGKEWRVNGRPKYVWYESIEDMKQDFSNVVVN